MERIALRTIALALLAVAAAAPWRAQAAGTITLGITSATAFSIPHYIAEEKKYYADEGLSVDTIIAGSANGVLQQLAAGSLNIGQAATDQTLRAIQRGAPIRIIAGAASNAPFRMLAAKGTKGWGELKGKAISVGGLTDVTLYFLRTMARKNGLGDKDYDLLYGGGSPNRLTQLLSGAVAGAILTNPHDFMALEQGFVDLGSVPDYLPHWAQNNIQVDTRWAAQHRAEILAFLRIHIRATRYFYDPANRAEVIAILAKHTKSTPDVAAKTYDLYVRQQVIAPDAALFTDGLQQNIDALVAIGEFAAAPPLANFIDPSFLAEVAEKMTASGVAERIRTRKIMCGEMPAFLAEPEGAAQGAVIVIHERYGLTRHICELAERFAADGYVAVAPDLYFRHPDQAALRRGDAGCDVSDPDALAALEQVTDALARETSADLTRLAAMGICQTARLPLVLAAARPLAAALVWYGAAQPREWQVDPKYPRALDEIVAKIACPVLGMFGETDHLISLDDVRRLRDCLERHGKSYDIHVYRDAPHGWLNDTMPGRYRRAQAEAAWADQRAFLRAALAPDRDRSTIVQRFAADVAPDYDFGRNVRYE